jgi:uncharacterized protein YecE (DUF72 family)
MKDRSWVAAKRNRRLRHAIEIRHESFMTEEFTTLLRKHRVALVVADTAQKWPYMTEMTTDFAYVRLHGDVELYASGYDDKALDLWADRIRKWRQRSQVRPPRRHAPTEKLQRERDVYVYFDNDIKAYAPFNAIGLARRLGIRRDCGTGIPASNRVQRRGSRTRPFVFGHA